MHIWDNMVIETNEFDLAYMLFSMQVTHFLNKKYHTMPSIYNFVQLDISQSYVIHFVYNIMRHKSYPNKGTSYLNLFVWGAVCKKSNEYQKRLFHLRI